LEGKVLRAEDLNISLQSELDQARIDQSNMERDLREQLEAAQGTVGDTELQRRFDDLERRHQNLQAELQEQQQVTEEVRRDAANFLKEMRAMSERSNATWEREEKLSRDVNRLEEEVKEWKGRYVKARTQLRHLRTSSIGISNFRTDVGALARQNELMQPNGLVKDVYVTKFQISIDELLRIARSGEPGLVLDQVKVVVVAVRHITQDLETSHGNEELPPMLKKAKTRVSTTANNLITASKNFASSSGLSPVSLLDAAASHLSTAIVELLRLVKIRLTPAEELEEDEEEDNIAPMQSPGYFSVAPSQSRLSINESVYSAISSPSVRSRSLTNSRRPMSRNGIPNGVGGGMKAYGGRAQDNELEELKVFLPSVIALRVEASLTSRQLYLEDQTEGLVQSIQALVSSIRAGDDITTIRNHISTISGVVGNVVSSTENSLSKPDINPALRERLGSVVQTLANCRNRLSTTGAEGEDISNPAQLRDVTSKLPPIAFEIARETKELVQRIDQLEFDDGDDDFR
jgi:predicted nuclease with TOPRIM domain